MSGIASFIIKKRISSIWEWPKIAMFLFKSSIALLAGLSYGIGAGFGVDFLVEQGVLSVSEWILLYSMLLAILCLYVDIVPFLKIPESFFKPYHPVSFKEISKLFLYFSFARNFWVFILLMYGLTISISKELSLFGMLPSFLFVTVMYLLNRLVRQVVYFKIPYSKLSFITALLVLIGAFFAIWILGNYLLSVALLLILLGVILSLNLYLNYYRQEKASSNSGRYRKGVISRILANKNMKTLFGVCFIIKVLIVGMLLINSLAAQTQWDDLMWFIWLCISPLIIFSNIGYNFFGINRTLFLTHALRENNFKSLFAIYIKVIAVLLCMDVLIVSIPIVLFEWFSWELLLFYLTSFTLFFSTAFILSLYTPIIKEKYYSLDFEKHGSQVVSIKATITAIIILMVTIGIGYTDYALFLNGVLVIVAVALLRLYPISFSEVMHGFFQKMKKVK